MVQRASAARERAHAPYSGYRVGACVLDDRGEMHVGCNVENASFGLTICAERNAVASMVVAGGSCVVAVAIVTADGGSPCGACRQVLAEFAGSEAETSVLCAHLNGHRTVYPLAELLPHGFRLQLESHE